MHYMLHPDPEVRQAISALCARLCTWERTTGRQSVLIIREQGGFVFRASGGKPVQPSIPDDLVTDEQLIDINLNP